MNIGECGEGEFAYAAGVPSIFLYPESSFEVMVLLVARTIRNDKQFGIISRRRSLARLAPTERN